jgi:3'-phosphoadenosine 5'-phosphosulfate sulfotransferase (PAPS reductase)/FAD synthetase
VNPFRIEGPAILSISGGRTSGYMLWRILQAHGGTLPDDVRPIFANTGKEMQETLDFVDEMSLRWKTPIVWIEYRSKADDGKKQHAIVNWHTAARHGEPYAALIEDRKYLPNPVARFCTGELKIRPMHRVVREWGWKEWISCLGIRADEPRRVAKLAARSGAETPDEIAIAPLAQSGVAVEEVGQFWLKQPFDLRLPNMNGKTMHGNCDLCFLKGAKQVYSLIREQPKRAIWWMEQEAKVQSAAQFKGGGARFRSDRPSYRQMYDAALAQDELFAAAAADEPLQDCMCVD